ncbi:MAG: type II secretion system F family protein [Actinobacteria bacterium]|nr:MAG: type II secretion system F family protein [Actinomycetota bacterium]
MLFVIFIGLVCLAISAYFVGDAVTLPARERHTSVNRAARYGSFRPSLGAAHKPFRERVLAPLGERLARWTLKLHPRTTVDGVSARLLAAGLGRSLSPTAFLAFKSGLAIGGIVLGALFGGAVAGAGGVLFLSVTLAGLGFILPDLAVSSKARQRKERIRAELPDALDLMAVSVEAGMGFDGAISKLTDHMSGPLADEFALTLSEIRIGETRQDALKKLSARTSTPELATFVRAIIQADQLGISLGRILRVQATDSRLKRQAAAEEKAMKAPIKMLFPTVLFIFPAMFLVILGPAFLNLSKIF